MKLKKGVGLLLVSALLISLLGTVFPPGEVLAASLFEIGDRVEVSGVAAPDGLLVRAGPGSAYNMIGGKWGGDQGVVVDGPEQGWHSVHGWLTWYRVKWDQGWYHDGQWIDTGWSAEGGFKEPPIIITFIEPDVGTTWATLKLYHNFNEFGSGHVQFGCRRTGTATWSYTGWEGASGVAIYEKTVTDLDPGTRYEYRAWLTYWVGEWVNRAGLIFEFETQQDPDPAGPVSVATHSATSVGETQATLRGAITNFNNNPSAEIRFWYRPTAGGSWTSTTWATRTSTVTYSQTVYGLAPDTEYEFYAQGRGSIDTTLETGDTLPFETLPSDPDPAGPVSVATHSATSVGETQATLRGAITNFNNNPSADLRFRYREQGTTPWTYTTWTTRTSTTVHSSTITGLTAGTDYEFEAEGHGNLDTTVAWGSTQYFTTSTTPGNAPVARASDISGQEEVMYPHEQYTVTAKYFDADGREDLQYCYLRLVRPVKPLTMMWYQADGHAAAWTGEQGATYLTEVSVVPTPITEGGLEGYELEWRFMINDEWPEVQDAIDFAVFAMDDSGLESGIDTDDTKASFLLSALKPPVASFDYAPQSPVISGHYVEFRAHASYHPDFLRGGEIVNYIWDFGDGTIESGEGRVTVTHQFRGHCHGNSKIYDVTLTVEDNFGATDTIMSQIVVLPLSTDVEVVVPSEYPWDATARLTVWYNWVDEVDGQNVYIVSKARAEADAWVGYYSFFIHSTRSSSEPTVVWWDLLSSYIDKTYYGCFSGPTFFPDFSRLLPKWEPKECAVFWYGKDALTGFAVYGSDVIELRAIGIPAGVHIGTNEAILALQALASGFAKVDVTCFDPEYGLPYPGIRGIDYPLWGSTLASPGELRVYDSQGRITGVIDGDVVEQIPDSLCTGSDVLISSACDSYTVRVVGTEDGTYGLSSGFIRNPQVGFFAATDIPTTDGAVHDYSIDWDALARGERGVSVSVDAAGDGIFDRTFTAGSTLAAVQTDTGTGTAFVTTSHGVVEGLEAVPLPSDPPPGVCFPHGLFSFNVTEIKPGDTITLTIDLPEPVPTGARWWKHGNGEWFSLPNETDNGDNLMTIVLTDGGLGDADGVADGVITDPGGPGIRQQQAPTAGAAYPTWTVLLAGLMGVASLLMLRRRHGGQESA